MKDYPKCTVMANGDTTWNRRSFLNALGLFGGGTFMLGGHHLLASPSQALPSPLNAMDKGRVLVIINLEGGNDGLNTVVPLKQYQEYADARPRLKYGLDELYELSPDFGMPNFLTGFQSLWEGGAMKIVQGVGYPNSSQSHEEAALIWDSLDTEGKITSGVFGRYFEKEFPDYEDNPPLVPPAIKIKSQNSALFDGQYTSYAFTVSRPHELRHLGTDGNFYDVSGLPECTYGNQVEFLRNTMNESFEFSSDLYDAFSSSSNSVEYGNSNFGRDMATVARFIKGDIATKVYRLSISGFDTHKSQKRQQERLIKDLSENIKLFFDDLSRTGHHEHVICMTTSEFGRKLKENGANGTGHGTAAPLLLFGPALQGNGFVGTHPDLKSLDSKGDLAHNIDFRSIYSTILSEWLCLDPEKLEEALLGKTYDTLPLGLSCDISFSGEPIVEEGEDQIKEDDFSHMVLYSGDQVTLRYVTPNDMQLDIRIFDISGQYLGTVEGKMAEKGEHLVNINERISGTLSQGPYIYRISTLDGNFSKVFVMP